MYSKLGDLEEPAGHLHEQEAEHQADNLPQARSHTAPEALNPQRVSETSLAETRASSTEGAKAAQGQETPQQQLQQQQQQSLREARQPFKQLQQSQPQQQQQLELQHLHLLPHKTPVQTHLLQQKQQRPDPNSDHGQGHKQQASYQDVDLVDATSTTPPAQLSSATLQLSRPQEQQHAQSQTSALQQGQQQRQHAAVSPFASMQHLPHAAQDQQQLIQPQQHQQQEQQHSHAVGSTLAGMQGLQAAERSAVLQLQGWGLAVASLAPRRLWAFMSLGIPGGLASSVEGAAAEVTTALAGVLGGAVGLNAVRALPCFMPGSHGLASSV